MITYIAGYIVNYLEDLLTRSSYLVTNPGDQEFPKNKLDYAIQKLASKYGNPKQLR